MYSECFPDASTRANEAINYARSELDTNIIDSCIDACKDCWGELKQMANNRLSEPDSRVTVSKDAKRLVEALLDAVAGNNKKLNQLFDTSQSPEIPSEQSNHAKSFIGALILKNGFKNNPPSRTQLRKLANIK